ncbi:MAG: hypothetical protein ACYC7E_03210 [Armatimonadota bacterium]
MRIFGWMFGSLLLADGLSTLIGGPKLMRRFDSAVRKSMPAPVSKVVHSTVNVNGTAMTVMGVSNLLAGMGMVLTAMLTGRRSHKRVWWK